MSAVKTEVFIEINRLHLGEIQNALAIPLDKILIDSNRRGTGCKSDHAVRFLDYLRRNDGRTLEAQLVISFYCDEFHNFVSFPSRLRRDFRYHYTILKSFLSQSRRRHLRYCPGGTPITRRNAVLK